MEGPAAGPWRGEVLLLHPLRLRAQRGGGSRGPDGQQAASGPEAHGGGGVGRGEQGEGAAGGEAEGDQEDKGGGSAKGK